MRMVVLMLLMVLILMLLMIKLLVLMTDVAVDRNAADVTISLLIIINNVIHSVINTSSLIINIKISTISIKGTIRMIINLRQTQARHTAPDTEQQRQEKKKKKNKTQTKRNKPQKVLAPFI